jgi:lysine/ornithine N-monooxygenase
MSKVVDVAVIGAGPYGLSLAAHLRGSQVPLRIFGLPMNLWRTHMPAGMFLKSQGFASNLSDPAGSHTLEQFCRESGRAYTPMGEPPVRLDTFVSYGQWFQRAQVPELEEVLVTDLSRRDGVFQLLLSNGETARAHAVVVAVGVEHFAYVPEALAPLGEACTHSSEHADLSRFEGQEVTVIGAGQSALETAALLHEHGAGVRLVAREPTLAWNPDPPSPTRSLYTRLRHPESGLGSGPRIWFYSTQPALYTRLSEERRVRIARTALGPAGAAWLRPRVLDSFPLLLGHAITGAEATANGARLHVRRPDGSVSEFGADHVIAATGFRPDLGRLSFLGDGIRAELRTIKNAPDVGRNFQSSVPGLHFVGPAVASRFGPVMRFVYGADFVARQLSARLAASRPARVVSSAALVARR